MFSLFRVFFSGKETPHPPGSCQTKKGHFHSCGPDVSFVGRGCQSLLTPHADAQRSAVRAGSGSGRLTCGCLFLTLFFPPSPCPPPSSPTSLQQVRTSPPSRCPSPPSWWGMSMTLWCCLRLDCPTGRSCCSILSAPSGTLVTWWFVPTVRLCWAMPRASSEISQPSTR